MGTISPYNTASGKRYRVRYRTPDHRQTDKRGFHTKREAAEFLAAVETAKASGQFVNAADGRATIGALGNEWLRHQGHLKPSSARPFEIAWRLYVEPVWGPVSVSDIRHSAVQAWLTDLQSGKPRSATTILRAYGVLAAILDVAVRDRRINSNPACGVKLPRKVKRQHPYLSHGQVDLLAGAASRHGTLIELLAYSGLRWGEATALRIRDLDMLRRRVNVAHNAVMVGGIIHVGTRRTHESRSVPFPDFITVALAQLCEGEGRDQLVFGDGDNLMRPPDSRREWWVSALRQA